MNKDIYYTRDEALLLLSEGKRVRFHWKGQVTEINLNTTLDDLRWNLMANLELRLEDVSKGRYSVIQENWESD